MTKNIFFIAFALCVAVSTQAEVLKVMVSPWGNNEGGSNSPEPLCGTMTGLDGNQIGISNSPGVMIDQNKMDENGAEGSVTYAITFSDHPEWGDISFDLKLTAAAKSGPAGLLYNGEKYCFWSVDTGSNSVHGTAADEGDDESRIRSGESITFAVSHVRSKGNVVTFAGFNGLAISQSGSFNKRTGVFTGADDWDHARGVGGRVNQLQLRFKIEPHVATIPETHAFALICGVLALGCGIVGRRQASSKNTNTAGNC